jgi:biopolymer transport protein ExbD
MMMEKKGRRRRISSAARITLTPLIDTALVLLVIFMVATPMMRNAIKVELPKGMTKETDVSHQDIALFIDSKNNIYVDGVQVPYDAVIPIIAKKVGEGEDHMVIVYADEMALWGPVMELVDHLKSVGGIRHVAFPLQRPTKQSSS